ncbi:MAG: putative DNA-binding transcriptional regulator YafY [Cocleimonas sp.]|jgi:predicted DNA-binding transcriptional regulator YafY
MDDTTCHRPVVALHKSAWFREYMENRELLAQRIVDVITQLNAGEILDIDELAEQFNVSKRTIQRDINSRLSFLPLQREGSKVSLLQNSLGKLTHKDIRNFAELIGAKELFPSLDSHFITSLLSNEFNSPYMVTGNAFEHDQAAIRKNLKKIESAIHQQTLITFSYKEKQYSNISPYKLINHNQVWYLAALDNDQLKTFHLAGLTAIFSLEKQFSLDENISEQIKQSDSIYIAEASEKIEVVLKVSPVVAHYFKRRQLLPEQIIDKELESGELIVSSKISYDLQIVPLIKYWMPHLQVISPKEIHDQIIKDIDEFKLNKIQ